ncbi:MAG: hypothetical protein AB8B63_20520 [Granulosicoccus sp.]
MGFTTRQVYCLERMGIVPWVLKASVAASNHTVPAGAVASVAAELAASAVPDEFAVFMPWLADQSLLEFTYRGVSTAHTGARDAPLLVISEAEHKSAEGVPFDTDQSALFDLMMQAIGLNRTHCCLCAVSGAGDAPCAAPDAVSIPELCSQQTRAVIYFSRQFRETLPASEQQGLLPSPSVPLWRIPHPALLLANPQLKRLAWESLKAIKSTLER